MLKIFINGLSGKMGQSVSKIANDKNYIISNAIESCDVVIDFSHPNNLSEMLKSSIKFKKPIIIGTTGFSKQQFKTIEKAAQEIPIMYSSNFSDGVLNLKKTIESFIKNSSESFSCEIEETHHTEKIDFPSGTAIDLRNFIMSVDKKNIVKSIKITSFRKENVYGDHKVSFYNKENFRNFKHEALSRDIFAKGALKRAESLFQAKPGLYDLSSFK